MWNKFGDKQPKKGQKIVSLLNSEYDAASVEIYIKAAPHIDKKRAAQGEMTHETSERWFNDDDLWIPYPPTPPTPTPTIASSGEKQASNEKQTNLLMIIKQGIEKDG